MSFATEQLIEIDRKPEESEAVSHTRNGWLRRKLEFIPKWAAKVVVKYAPEWLSNPNLWTLASAILTPHAVRKSTLRNLQNPDGINFGDILEESAEELAELGGATGIDFFDGSLAREKNIQKPGSHDTRKGGSNDALNDRWSNFVMGVSRQIVAFARGDRYGVFIATASTIARAIPAWQRSEEEIEGRVYPESGKNCKDILGLAGTHSGSTPLAMAATLYPRVRFAIKGWKPTLPLQWISDTLTFIGAVKVIIQRSQRGTDFPLPDPSEKKEYEEAVAELENMKADAEYREPRLFRAAVGTTVVSGLLGLGMLYLMSRKEKNLFLTDGATKRPPTA